MYKLFLDLYVLLKVGQHYVLALGEMIYCSSFQKTSAWWCAGAATAA